MRQNIVSLLLIVLLGVLGSSWVLGASRVRSAARSLASGPQAPEADASAAAGASSAGAAAKAPPASPKPPASATKPASRGEPGLGRPLVVTGLGWDLLAPGLLAAGGLKSTPKSAFAKEGLEVVLFAGNSMSEIEHSLARGGGSEEGADLAVLPLSQLVLSFDRLRALDLHVFFVSGWSQGRDYLTGTPLPKLPFRGPIRVENGGQPDALTLALTLLDLSGVDPSRLDIDAHHRSADVSALSRQLDPADRAEQEDRVVSTREASRLLPHVLVAPRPLLDDQQPPLVHFVKGWLGGTDAVATDRAAAARRLASFDGAPETLTLLHALGELEFIRLQENAELLGLSGRSALSIEALVDRSFRVFRAARVTHTAAPEQALVDGRVVSRLARAEPKLLRPAAPGKRRSAAGRQADKAPLLVSAFSKDDEEAVIDTIGFLAAVFPRSDVRFTLLGGPGRKERSQERVDRAADRYGIEADRLIAGGGVWQRRAVALVEVLTVP